MAGTEQHYRRILRTGIWYYLNLKLGILCFGIQLFFDLSFENVRRDHHIGFVSETVIFTEHHSKNARLQL